jgi:hypothetical protein
MSKLFSDLQAESEKQKQVVQQQPTSPIKKYTKQLERKSTVKKTVHNHEQQPAQNVEQGIAQTNEQVSIIMSKLPDSEEIELMNFRLRKVGKVKVNTEVPEEWKQLLDDVGHRLHVGKYELLLYIIAQFLDKTEQDGTEHQKKP